MSTPDFLKKLFNQKEEPKYDTQKPIEPYDPQKKPIEDLDNSMKDFASKRDNNELEDYYSESAKSIGITKEEFKEMVRKNQEGEDKELLNVKDNSGGPLENFLNSEKNLSTLAYSVACWARVIEIIELKNEMIPSKDVVRFCRLFLEYQKKRNHIKDYNRADVRVMKMLVLSIGISDIEGAIKENNLHYPSMKEFEKEIGY